MLLCVVDLVCCVSFIFLYMDFFEYLVFLGVFE